jgi:hypothetical protein
MKNNEINEISLLKGQIVRIDTEYHDLPIFGRFIALSSQFLTIERKDGRLTFIKRKAILSIEAVRNQQVV